MFTIEKHVPLPSKRIPRPTPLENMQVGDSFLVPCKTASDYQNWAHSAHIEAQRLGIGITTRRMPDGLRVWKTSNSMIRIMPKQKVIRRRKGKEIIVANAPSVVGEIKQLVAGEKA